MSSPERQLRLVQCGLIVFIGVCFFVKHIGSLETHDALSPVQWLIIVGAIWSSDLRVHSATKDQSHRESISNAVEKVDTG